METKRYTLLCVGEFTPDLCDQFRANTLGIRLSLELQHSPEEALRTLSVITYDAVLVHPNLRMAPDKFKAAVRSAHPFMVFMVLSRLPTDVMVQDLAVQIDESHQKIATHLIAGDIAFNPHTKKVLVQNREVKLTNENAVRLLVFMMRHPNHDLKRETLQDTVDMTDKTSVQYIDSLARDVRQVLRLSRKVTIETVRGVGYKLQVN